MMPKEYYWMEYEKNKDEIIAIIVCAILGVFVAGGMYGIYHNAGYIEKLTDFVPAIFLIPLPYGLYKTWNSCLVLSGGTSTMWVVWLIYITIKLLVAVFYGLIGMPIMLVAQTAWATINKRKMQEALPMRQMAQYNNQYQQYPVNQQIGYSQYNNRY